jgi:hypothetical protein
MRQASVRLGLLLSLWLMVGCAPSIALYSPAAYERAVDLKVETLDLMDRAAQPFSEHQSEVQTLRLDIEKAREYARGLPKNEITAQQWDILMDPQEQLLGAFLDRWQSGTPLGATFIAEKKLQIGRAFDTIIGLESHKLKPAALRQN